jgi:hypothetical protein
MTPAFKWFVLTISLYADYVTVDKIIDHNKNIMNANIRTRNLAITLTLAFMIIFTRGVAALNQTPSAESALSQAAHSYVHLGLELGQYDPDYVDAYLGPKEWQEQAAKPRSKKKLASDIAALGLQLSKMSFEDDDLAVRHKALSRNVRAMDVRVRMVNGETFTFTDEALMIYDVVLPEFDFAEFDVALSKIDQLLPGQGDLSGRVDAFRSKFDIPAELVEKVIGRAIEECRIRSKKYISMPEQESFNLEYVTGKNWTGYNWYQGESISLMQMNQDFPTKINSAIGLGCHEGYPGHHVWNVLIEEELIKDKGWVEFNLYPLFSPYGLIAEGSAEYGVGLAFPNDERIRFEQEVLYPMAGIDPKGAVLLERVEELLAELKYSSIAIGKLYLDGKISRDEAVTRTIKYSLVSEKKANASIRFVEQYRAYVLNYSIGEHLIDAFIAKRSETHEERWGQFKQLLTELKTASDLVD